MIEATELTKHYGPIPAIEKVTFSVKAGEVVGLLGPNGAGKTTTLRILTGYMPPSSGHVLIGGIDLLKDPIGAKKKIGYLPETPPLYPELTVEETLRFVAGIHQVKQAEKRIEELLRRIGLIEVRRRLVAHISKGYRQRLGIAQALIHDPQVLILDEPTIGLDPKQILEIRSLLAELKGRQAIILSSHILQEVTAICDRVVIINRGRIVADGTLAELAGKTQKKRYLVTVSSENGVRSRLEATPGVEEVKEYTTDLEALFLKLTGEGDHVAAH